MMSLRCFYAFLTVLSATLVIGFATADAVGDDSITPATVNLQDMILVDYRERSPSLIPLPSYHHCPDQGESLCTA